MPKLKTRSKDDTWTTEDLTKALQGTRDGNERKYYTKDEEGKNKSSRQRKESGKQDRVEGHYRSDLSEKSMLRRYGGEADRERMRMERRERREGGSKREEDRLRKQDKMEDKLTWKKPTEDRESGFKVHHRRDDKAHEVGYDGSSRGDGKKDFRSTMDDDKERRRRERRERREQERDAVRHSRHYKVNHETGDEDRSGHKERLHTRQVISPDKDHDERAKYSKSEDGDVPSQFTVLSSHHGEKSRAEKTCSNRGRNADPRLTIEEKITKHVADIEGGSADIYDDDDFEDYAEDFEDEGSSEDSDQGLELTINKESFRVNSLSDRGHLRDSPDCEAVELNDDGGSMGFPPPHHHDPDGGHSSSNQTRSVINFASAKNHVMKRAFQSKACRRAEDLKSMIDLDVVSYDILNLPPAGHFDTYIRSFARTDVKQACVQTNDDATEQDVQTEDVNTFDKWTQHPAVDNDVGGDGISLTANGREAMSNVSNDFASFEKYSDILEHAMQMIDIILDEGDDGGSAGGTSFSGSTLSPHTFSSGVRMLELPSFLTGRYVESVAFCQMQPSVFLTLHSTSSQPLTERPLDVHGLICVWNIRNLTSPEKLLVSATQPTCACFSPSRAALVIAGMLDGTVVLWDLRECNFHHQGVFIDGQEWTVRHPTYNTAGVLGEDNHHSPVQSITTVHSSVLRTSESPVINADPNETLVFQFATVEEQATVNLWVVTEIAVPDIAGSEIDLGLAPCGCVKLLRSSVIYLDNPYKMLSLGSFSTSVIQMNPYDLNHFLVGTDLGFVIHGVRFGSRVYPRTYRPVIDCPNCITCLDFSPFGESYFLVGCDDGSLSLYHMSNQSPLLSWPAFSDGCSVIAVRWSRCRPTVFLALADNSTLYTFDLVESGSSPVSCDRVATSRVTAMDVGNDPALIGIGKCIPANLILTTEDGSVQIHTVAEQFRIQQPLELDFLMCYKDRF